MCVCVCVCVCGGGDLPKLCYGCLCFVSLPRGNVDWPVAFHGHTHLVFNVTHRFTKYFVSV